MKKIILTSSLILFTFLQIFASKNESSDFYHYYGNQGSFNFIEDNVHFMVYQNGEFDFFIERPNISVDVDFGNVSITFNSGYNYDNYVLYDDYGAIIQIEDIPIYYDYYGRISQIGNTYIRYRNRRLIQFGGMYVHYNNYGYYDHCSGYVNRYNRYYDYRPYVSYFVMPVYTQCIVSYEPYRRYYRPTRYRYHSAEFRRRARNNSYYRTNTSKVVRRRVIPKRVASRDRVVRRSTATTRTNSHRTTHAVRRSASNTRNNGARRTTSNTRTHNTPRTVSPRTTHSVRRSTSNTRNNGARRTTTNTRTHNTPRTVSPRTTHSVRRTTSNTRNVGTRRTTSNNRSLNSTRKNTINKHINRSNSTIKRSKSYATRKSSPKRIATKRTVAHTSSRGHRARR